jgi:hypothetical protein
MSQENWLGQVDRAQPVRHSYPLPRAEVRLVSHLARIERPAASARSGETDNLREARGILYSALLGGLLWVLIGLASWLIAR